MYVHESFKGSSSTTNPKPRGRGGGGDYLSTCSGIPYIVLHVPHDYHPSIGKYKHTNHSVYTLPINTPEVISGLYWKAKKYMREVYNSVRVHRTNVQLSETTVHWKISHLNRADNRDILLQKVAN